LPILLIPLLSACAIAPGTGPSSDDSRPKVLATFTVLADMAREVSCGQLRVESITKPGAEIHGYEFTPSDLKRAQGAQLVLENGLDLEQWARRFTANLSNVPHVVLSQGVETLPIEPADRDLSAGGPPKANPHAWMSPRAALTYVANIRDAFIRLDPSNASTYQRCAASYGERLRELDAELAASLARVPPDQRLLVTCEGAFSYLARDYGLEEAWLWPVNGERQVTPQRMERVINKVRQRRLPAVFCESTVDDRAQRRVAAESGARFAGTFYVDSLSGPQGPASSYLSLMRHNVGLLVEGLTSGTPSTTPSR
jgi:manganese transport system substrate-binding protein